MARRLFFVDEVRLGRARLTGEQAHHLTRVLRVEPGQRYEISDNRELYLAEIETARKDEVSFTVVEKLAAAERATRLHLFAALIRLERFEWIVEKAAELGAASIHPLIAERSERGIERAAGKRAARWRRIAREACEQSRRAWLPEIGAPVREPAGEFALRLLFDELPGTPPVLSVIGAAPETAAVLIGPEGGWTGGERERYECAGWTRVSLGTGLLRAETAAVAALAVLNAAWAPYHEERCPKT